MAKKKSKETTLGNLTANCYKITLEESWHHERPEVRSPDRIWYEQILCLGGAFISVYPLTPLTLKLWTPRVKNARIVWEAIKSDAGAWADFCLDGEAQIFFSLDSLSQVAQLARAKRRRRLSETHKPKLVEADMAYRF
jgi:hypothetical protein